MVYLLAASLLWAFSFGLIKGQMAGLDPVVVACVRLFLAGLVFLPIIFRSILQRSLIARALALGVVQFGLMYVLYIASYAWLPAWKVAFFTIFTPLYVVLIAAARDRRLAWRHLAAAVLAVVGAALVVRTDAVGGDWRGILLLQGANLCFAAGQLWFVGLQRQAKGQDAALVGWMYLGAFGVTALAALLRSPSDLFGVGQWPHSALWAVLYLGLLPTGLGFYLWNKGAARTTAGALAVANNLKIPLAVLVSWTVFGEDAPFGRVLISLAVIVAGLAWVMPRRRDS